ncbi:hypothetical protein [Nocardiopsis kunsanensis]|uniref:hypothetical protein n=1 Tax=Nocardiopsis kunsanensis TaxID=141693 RepID=UPI000348D0B2|nr:hypothetical protein [Nocardiopsis kunsanensis]
MKKSATFALVSAAGLGLSLAATAPASAEPAFTEESVEVNIYEDGSIVEADAPQPMDSDDTILSNGLLSIQTTQCTYVRVSYVKDDGSPVDLSFGFYNSGDTYTGDTFYNVGAGQTVSETWSQINTSGSVVGFMDVPGQQQFNLPPVDCD